MQHPSHRLIQLALASMGYDPGPVDGWWGPRTYAAAQALLREGPVRTSLWAIQTLNRGLSGLGYRTGAGLDFYDVVTRGALGMVLDADGAPAASGVSSPDVLEPSKPALVPVQQTQKLLQGSGLDVIDTLCLHCAAVPGDWHRYKTNAEIVAAIHHMHTDPKGQGGRGWSDTGYHAITCPDGEVIPARPVGRYGAGAVGYNRGVYHLLMIEVATIDRTRRAEDYFTPGTLAATKDHIERVSMQTPITRLMGHREVAAKLCPGFDVIDREWTDRAVA